MPVSKADFAWAAGSIGWKINKEFGFRGNRPHGWIPCAACTELSVVKICSRCPEAEKEPVPQWKELPTPLSRSGGVNGFGYPVCRSRSSFLAPI